MGIIFFIISLLASIIGAICGIGGGVIIKPALDMFNLLSVQSVSFLSGCTVLSMTGYSVVRSFLAKEKAIQMDIGTPLAIGAMIGGVVGQYLFSTLSTVFENANTVGVVQSLCMFVVMFGSLIYTLSKTKIQTKQILNPAGCLSIGFTLGVMSSFLGIGGGPVNLVFLSYFFSMDIKTASKNSLYIILFGQLASLIIILLTGKMPDFDRTYLILMITGGVLGGIIGRVCNRKINSNTVTKLFIGLICLILIICLYNAWRYAIL